MSAYIRRLWVTSRHLNKNPDDFPLPVSSVSFSLTLVTISRRFEKRGEGWPTAFCLVLFSPAGDPFSSAFASDLSIFPFSLHSSCLFLFLFDLRQVYPNHCIVFFYEVVRRDSNSRNGPDYDFWLFLIIFTIRSDIFINYCDIFLTVRFIL